MSTYASDQFKPGDRVRTAATLGRRDFNAEALAKRRPNAEGVVVDAHHGHGVCFEVRHGPVMYPSWREDRAAYDPDELTLLSPSPPPSPTR